MTLHRALADFHQAGGDRIEVDPDGVTRQVLAEARLKELTAPHTVAGIVDLRPETIEELKRQINQEMDAKFSEAAKRFQHARLVAGILIQQELDRSSAPTWYGATADTASRQERMTARQLDLLEQRSALEWLALPTTTIKAAVDRYLATADGDDRGFVGAVEAGFLPAHAGTTEDTIALERLRDAKYARKVARLPATIHKARTEYVETLRGPSTLRTLHAIRNLKMVAR
jgi:hypothetical protein